jgi:lysophospholipase L1-like esterase
MPSLINRIFNPVYLASSLMGGIAIFAWFFLLLPQQEHSASSNKALFKMNLEPPSNSIQQQAGSPRSWLALGDSYTIGESVGENDRYPVQANAILGKSGTIFLNPEIIARTGWTTGDLLQALDDKRLHLRRYDVVSLLIGVNNQFQGRSQHEYKEEFSRLLNQSIQLASGMTSHVFVLSIPDYAVTPFASNRDTAEITRQIDFFNKINMEQALKMGVNYLDITGESRKARKDPSLVASDGLHFSAKEYAIWAKSLAALIQERIR